MRAPPTWPELLGDGTTLGMMARLLPITALRLTLEESSTVAGDHTCPVTEVSEAMSGSPADDGRGVAASLEGGMGSSPTASPPPKDATSSGLRVAALICREKEFELGEDFFMWPHPVNFDEALFMVDDTAKRAMREVASWSLEGVWVALSKMGNAITMVAQLGVEALQRMTNEVAAQAQVGHSVT